MEADSPAHYAGLKTGDRILEVEGVSVGLENQGQVVARIAASGVELSLLVADTECEEWHSARDIVITSGLPHVVSSCSALNIDIMMINMFTGRDQKWEHRRGHSPDNSDREL